MREQAASANGCDCLAVLVWPVASLAKHRVVHNADWTFTTAGGVLVAASGRVSWAACATLSSSNWSRAFTHFSIRYQDLPCEFSVVGTFRPTRPVVAFSSRLPSNDSRNKKIKRLQNQLRECICRSPSQATSFGAIFAPFCCFPSDAPGAQDTHIRHSALRVLELGGKMVRFANRSPVNKC